MLDSAVCVCVCGCVWVFLCVCMTLHCKKFGVGHTPNKVCYHGFYTHTFFGVHSTLLDLV